VNSTLVPSNIGGGYFSVKYLEKSDDWVDGVVHYGDVLMLYFEAPREIGGGEKIRLQLLPAVGEWPPVVFYTPDVINTKEVRLYP